MCVVTSHAHLRQYAGTRLREAGSIVGEPQEGGDGGAVPVPEPIIVLFAEGPATDRSRAVRDWAQANPQAHIILAVSTDTTRAAMSRALQAGADGVILEDEVAEMLVPAVRAVAAGLMVTPTAMRQHVAPRALSYREKQTLDLAIRGLTNRQIAERLWVAESTVKTHLASAFSKIDAHSRAEAAARVLDSEDGFGLSILAVEDDSETRLR